MTLQHCHRLRRGLRDAEGELGATHGSLAIFIALGLLGVRTGCWGLHFSIPRRHTSQTCSLSCNRSVAMSPWRPWTAAARSSGPGTTRSRCAGPTPTREASPFRSYVQLPSPPCRKTILTRPRVWLAQTVNIKALGADFDMADGERLPLPVKDLGSCDLYPQSLQHNMNGRFVVVCGDGAFFARSAVNFGSHWGH